jgi:hypothetical protein
MFRSVVVLASTALVFASGWSQTAEARDWRLRSLYDNYVLEEPPAYYFDDDFEDDEDDVVIVPPRRLSIYQYEDDYYDPRYEPRKDPARKLGAQKPPAEKPQKAAAIPAAKPVQKLDTVKPAAVSGVTCAKATSVVGTYGFTDVKPVACTGKVYTFSAARGAKKYEIRVSAANGSLTEVKKLQ